MHPQRYRLGLRRHSDHRCGGNGRGRENRRGKFLGHSVFSHKFLKNFALVLDDEIGPVLLR
jgi:hypothetical protein